MVSLLRLANAVTGFASWAQAREVYKIIKAMQQESFMNVCYTKNFTIQTEGGKCLASLSKFTDKNTKKIEIPSNLSILLILFDIGSCKYYEIVN